MAEKKRKFKQVSDREYFVNWIDLVYYIKERGVTKSHLAKACGFTMQTLYNKMFNKSYKGFTNAEEQILKRELNMSDSDFEFIFHDTNVNKYVDIETYYTTYIAENRDKFVNRDIPDLFD